MSAKIIREESQNQVVEPVRNDTVFAPRVNIRETEGQIVIEADMPGVSESGIDISLEKRILTIEGLPEKIETEGYGRIYSEFRYGIFRRSFSIQADVDNDNISASVKNGVLTIVLPKIVPAKKKIVVSAG